MTEPESDPVDDLTQAVGDINFRDLLISAVVRSFFAPELVGSTAQSVSVSFPGAPGMAQGFASVQTPTYGPSPMQQLVNRVWQQYGDEIVRRVGEAIDLDALVEQVSEKVSAKITDVLTSENEYGHTRVSLLGTSREDIRTRARDAVVKQVAADVHQAYTREQDEAHEALREKRERERREAIDREQLSEIASGEA